MCPFPHNEGPVYHMATGFVKFFGRFWSLRGSQEVCFGLIFSVAASGRAFFSLGPEALSKRQRANLYPCSLYLILYLPLRDLSGVLWYSVVSSPRNIKDLLCRKSPESYPDLFFFVFMVSWRLWRLLRVYCSHFSDILRLDTCTYSDLICTLLRQVFR